MSSYEVIVIGAGISGLGCGSRLSSAGKNVLILEGRNRIGGRIFSNNKMADCIPLGAGFLHEYAQGSGVLKKNLQDINSKIIPVDYSPSKTSVFDKAGQLSKHNAKKYFTVLDKLYSHLEPLYSNHPELDMHSAITQILAKKFKPEHVESLINEFAESAGELANNIRLHNFMRRGHPEFMINNGYLVNGYDELVNHLAVNLDIELNADVVNIEITKDNKVRISTKCGNQYTAERAVVTLPLGVLKAKSVGFTPDLPLWKQSAIKTLEVGHYNRVYLRFSEVFWEPHQHWFIYGGKSRGWFSQWFNLYPFINEPILCIFMSGPSVLKAEMLSDLEMCEHAMKILKQMFGCNIPKPNDFLVTRWGSDPFTKGGSHSFPNLKGSLENFELMAKPVGPLHFAGEASRNKLDSGTVGSSLESGYRAADEIINNNFLGKGGMRAY